MSKWVCLLLSLAFGLVGTFWYTLGWEPSGIASLVVSGLYAKDILDSIR